jgi:hypothetical protein
VERGELEAAVFKVVVQPKERMKTKSKKVDEEFARTFGEPIRGACH